MRIRFGDCTYDPGTREVVRDGRALEITPRAFELLGVLLRERPRALSKEQLHELLWPRTFVSDSSLARLVSELRKAIGDVARDSRYIRTVHGFGYAFSGEAVELEGIPPETAVAPHCWLVSGDRVVPLRDGENLLGRAVDSVLVIDSPEVSRRHTRILVTDQGSMLEDLGSKNGTYLEGVRLEEPVKLTDGDEISIGRAILTYRAGGESDVTKTVGSITRKTRRRDSSS